MKRKRFSITLTVLLVLLLGALVANAQEPAPQDPRGIRDALNTSSTHQGKLQKDASPDDSVTMSAKSEKDDSRAASMAFYGPDHWGESWYGSGTGLSLFGDVGLFGYGDAYGVHGRSKDGTGIYGQVTMGNGYGVHGSASGSNAYGVYASGSTGDLRLSDTGTIYANESSDSSLELHSNDHVEVHLDDDNNSDSYFRVRSGTDGSAFIVDEDGTVYVMGTGTIDAGYSSTGNMELYADDDVNVHLNDDGNNTSYFRIYKDEESAVFEVSTDGDIRWQERTGYVSISAAAFDPSNPGYTFYNYGHVLGIYADRSSAHYNAPVQLPHGATVISMTFYWEDSTSAYDGHAQLLRNPMNGVSGEEMAYAETSGSGGEDSSLDDTIDYASINNSQYSYYVHWYLPDYYVRGFGVVIEYTYTEPY